MKQHNIPYQICAPCNARLLLQQGDATETEETCTQYNMLKIARYLFRWTGNVTYADYYERAITNGLVGTQRMPEGGPAKPQTQTQTAAEGLLTLPGLKSGAATSSRRYCLLSTRLQLSETQ